MSIDHSQFFSTKCENEEEIIHDIQRKEKLLTSEAEEYYSIGDIPYAIRLYQEVEGLLRALLLDHAAFESGILTEVSTKLFDCRMRIAELRFEADPKHTRMQIRELPGERRRVENNSGKQGGRINRLLPRDLHGMLAELRIHLSSLDHDRPMIKPRVGNIHPNWNHQSLDLDPKTAVLFFDFDEGRRHLVARDGKFRKDGGIVYKVVIEAVHRRGSVQERLQDSADRVLEAARTLRMGERFPGRSFIERDWGSAVEVFLLGRDSTGQLFLIRLPDWSVEMSIELCEEYAFGMGRSDVLAAEA